MAVPTPGGSVPPAWQGRVLERALGTAWDRSSSRARRLVDAARTLATQRPSAEFTVAEVAEHAGVALRTFYRHFGGRDDLLLALFEEEALRGEPLLRAAIDAGSSPTERLRGYVVQLCDMLATGSGYAWLLLREYLRLGESRPAELRTALAPLIDLLETELRAAAAAGAIRPVDRFDAVVVFTSVLAHIHAAALFGEHVELRDSAERLWAFFHTGLAPVGARR